MPFFDEQRSINDLSNIQTDEPAPDPAALQTWGAAFRTQNTVGSFVASSGIPDAGIVEDGYDAIADAASDPKYAPFVTSFAGIRNRKAGTAQKLRIDQELQDQRTLAASGTMGTIAQVAAGVVDLPTLASFGGGAAISGGSKLALAGRAALGAGIDTTFSEGVLQATQATRTAEESALNIGGSIVLGGALGLLAGRYLDSASTRSLSSKIEGQEAAFAEADREFTNMGKGASAGAAARDVGPLALKDEAFISKLPIVNRQDPLIRLQLNEIEAGREAVRGLAETPLEYADNAAGVATERGGAVETRMKMWHAPLATALREIDTSYAKYFHGAPEPTAFQRFLAPMQSEFDRARGSTDRLTYKQFKEEVGKAAFSGEQHPIAQVAEAAKIYRKLDDAMKKAAIEAKLLPEDVSVKGDVSHLFRMYNKDKIIARRGEFSAVLNDHFITARNAAAERAESPLAKKAGADGKIDPKLAAQAERDAQFGNLSDAEVKGLVDDTIDSILGHADSRIPYDIVSGPRGPLKERVLNIESRKIQDFLNTDIEEVLRAQIRTMSADVEIARKFGSVDMAEQIRKINDEANARIATETTEKGRQRVEASRKAAIRDLSGIRDRLRGQYALPSNPDSLVLRAGRLARNINYLRLLGGMTVSAIPDLGKVVFAHGLTSTFRDGFIPMMKNFKAFRLAAQEVKDAGTALDMVLDSRAMSMAEITDDFGRHSAFERGLSSLSTRFGVVSLMAPWNATLKQFTGLLTMTNILRSAGRVAAGKGTARDIRNLASSGIDHDLAERITKQFATHGDNQDGVLLAKAGDWSDREAREAFRTAVVREVDRAIVTPGQDKPLWMSTELGKAVGQFKSFGISSMQKTMLTGMQQRDAATLNGVLVSLGLGAFTYWAKSASAGRETSDDPTQWAVEALDKSGLTGWLMDANNITEKATRGRVGFSAITGKPVSRYASRNVTGAFLGPTADAVSDIFQVSGSVFAGDTTKSDLHKVRQLIPANNLFYVRSLFDKVEAITGDALDLPDTRKK
ncbi:hypothetical protein [Mesorhizobium sp. B2-6-7]|uniref:hypothetical protein n=1 Tax=Mesorhizobium sp. B2-6-7 TaxID=2589910 RepID=UPI001FEE2548|nr:hypothetical protein [Mesorhizobium sp. B2-6-7]